MADRASRAGRQDDAGFRKDNGQAIRLGSRDFLTLGRKLDLFTDAFVTVGGSKFKAVKIRDRNFSKAKTPRRLKQIEETISRYLGHIETADRKEAGSAGDKVERLEERIAMVREEMQRLNKLEMRMQWQCTLEMRRGSQIYASALIDFCRLAGMKARRAKEDGGLLRAYKR